MKICSQHRSSYLGPLALLELLGTRIAVSLALKKDDEREGVLQAAIHQATWAKTLPSHEWRPKLDRRDSPIALC